MNELINVSNIKTFYINLKHYTSNKTKFEKNNIINFQRFPAVFGKQNLNNDFFLNKISLLTQAQIHFNFRDRAEQINSIGAIGCGLSHYYLWKSFLDEKIDDEYLKLMNDDEQDEIEKLNFSKKNCIEDDYLFVFEDDANFDVYKIKEQIPNVLNDLNSNDWDIFLLSCIKRDISNLQTEENFSITLKDEIVVNNCNSKYCKVSSFFGTECYIIKKSAIKKIIESNLFFPIECHIDAFLGILSQKNILKIVTPNKPIINGQTLRFSSIGHSVTRANLYLIITILISILIIIFICLIIAIKVKKAL